MTAYFYKTAGGNSVLLTTRNIEYVPPTKTVVIYRGQKFCVDKLEFDLDNYVYNIYMSRV